MIRVRGHDEPEHRGMLEKRRMSAESDTGLPSSVSVTTPERCRSWYSVMRPSAPCVSAPAQ
jgi:hypothetical protein